MRASHFGWRSNVWLRENWRYSSNVDTNKRCQSAAICLRNEMYALSNFRVLEAHPPFGRPPREGLWPCWQTHLSGSRIFLFCVVPSGVARNMTNLSTIASSSLKTKSPWHILIPKNLYTFTLRFKSISGPVSSRKYPRKTSPLPASISVMSPQPSFQDFARITSCNDPLLRRK